MGHRTDKVAALIKKELSDILSREISLPKTCLATITEIEALPNMQKAKIMLSIYPAIYRQKALAKINSRLPYIQSLLNQKLVMRHVPRIYFELDKRLEEEEKLNKIFDEIKEEARQS